MPQGAGSLNSVVAPAVAKGPSVNGSALMIVRLAKSSFAGRAMGVGVTVGVRVGHCEGPPGVQVAVGVGVRVGVAVPVPVPVGVGVGEGVPVPVGVGVRVGH